MTVRTINLKMIAICAFLCRDNLVHSDMLKRQEGMKLSVNSGSKVDAYRTTVHTDTWNFW